MKELAGQMRRFLNLIGNHRNWIPWLIFRFLKQADGDFTFHTRSAMEVKVPRRMLQTWKECFFDETYLNTFKGLDAARHLYESFGFVLTQEEDGSQWGSTVTEQQFRRRSQGRA